jgi:hypothetical protein
VAYCTLIVRGPNVVDRPPESIATALTECVPAEIYVTGRPLLTEAGWRLAWLANSFLDVPSIRPRGKLSEEEISFFVPLGLYADRVNSSMLAAADSMMRALQPGLRTVQ